MTDTKTLKLLREQAINQLNNLIDFTDRMGGLKIARFKSHALLHYLKKYKISFPMYKLESDWLV